MTIRLSAMFEEHIRRIISTWKSAQRCNNNTKTKRNKKNKKGKQPLTNGTGEYSSIVSRINLTRENIYRSTYIQDLPSRNLSVAMMTRMQIVKTMMKSLVKSRKRKVLTF